MAWSDAHAKKGVNIALPVTPGAIAGSANIGQWQVQGQQASQTDQLEVS